MKMIIPHELTDLNTYINAERANRHAGANIKRDMTNLCAIYAKRLKTEFRTPVHITYRWYCKNKRKDKSNIAFAKKFIEDGLVNAGVLKNDGWNDIEGMADEFYIDSKNPRIEVEITEVSNG